MCGVRRSVQKRRFLVHLRLGKSKSTSMMPLQQNAFFDQVAINESELSHVERAAGHPGRHHQRVPFHEEDEDVLEYLARLLEASRGVVRDEAAPAEDEQVVPFIHLDQRVPFSAEPMSSSSRHGPSSDAFVPHHRHHSSSSSSPDTRRAGRQPAVAVPVRPIGGERTNKQQQKAWQFVPQQHPNQQRWSAGSNVNEVPFSGLSLNESFEAAYERMAKPLQARSAALPRYRQQTARANPAMSVWIPEGAKETVHRCAECLQTLTRKSDLRKHLQLHDVFECPACRGLFGSLEGLNAHRRRSCYAASSRANVN